MLVIRREQMDAFAADAWNQVEQRMIDHVELHAPAELRAQGPEAIAELVRGGIALARRHGIESEEEIAALLDVAAELGADFEPTLDETGVGTRILADHSLPPEARVELLHIELLGRPPQER